MSCATTPSMHIYRLKYPLLFGIPICFMVLVSCKTKTKKGDQIAGTPQELQEKTTSLIQNRISGIIAGEGQLNDTTIAFNQPRISKLIYEKRSFEPIWCNKEKWLPAGDSLFFFIESSQLFGLFPEDYHVKQLKAIRTKFFHDSLSKGDRKDAGFWSDADMMLTDAFIQVIKDIKLGRLPQDSITLRKDSVLSDDFYLRQFDALQRSGITGLVQSLEPQHKGYHLLKAGIKKFIDSADYKEFTMVPFGEKDLASFNRSLQKRLYEGGFIAFDSVRADSAQLATAVKEFQKKKGITVDGRAGEGTLRMLNVNDREKFIRIAISMDKYKMLPEKMPSKYIWVNVSANYLELVLGDTIKLGSKVICGKAKTRTPVLTSNITELITYPQWVPPPSIVSKEILPAVKRNPGYLARKGFSLVDSKGNEVDPYSVDWSRYKKTIPYRIVQGSGDANALGIMKFVFSNKYSVYLHDTNQRYLFANAMRSLSHGCVRVQEWEKLTYYILRNDSLNAGSGGYTKMDSVKKWLQKKQKKSIAVRNKIPVYIRYITCEGRDGSILFYDDVYAEDKMLREKYFSAK
ncbi:MAG: L,D-transpeptidase family protein [Ferruginibacter sp.]|nr:L,D-transpeptidase family protein [Chitinophagaceae bacterium]